VDVALPPEAKTDLLWWSEAMLRFRDAQVLRGLGAKVVRQHSDASGDGWGCTSEEYGSGSVDYNYDLFSPDLSAHKSNVRYVRCSRSTLAYDGRGSSTQVVSTSISSPHR
jgi:hypothetical protein